VMVSASASLLAGTLAMQECLPMRETKSFNTFRRCRDAGMLGCEHYGCLQQSHVCGICRSTQFSVARYCGVCEEVLVAVAPAQ
jgi:hypothetical protein